MISITGYEANGWQMTPGNLQTFAMIFILFVICLNIFTKGTSYQSVSPLYKNPITTPLVNPDI